MKQWSPAIAAALFAALAARAIAAPPPPLSYADTPYTLASACVLSQPIVFLNVVARNGSKKASGPVTLQAADTSGVLIGSLALASIDPGVTAAVIIPLRSPGMNPAAIAGQHAVTVSAGGFTSAPLLVQIPPAFCAPAAAAKPPAAAPATAAPGSGTITAVRRAPIRAVVATPAPKGNVVPTQIATNRASNLSLAVRVGVPSNLRAVNGAPDCAVHVGLIGALVCPDMIKSGDLLLVWDWDAGGGPDVIDGYRVYRVDGGRKQLLQTRANKKDLTLVDLAKPAGGYNGTCYAVTAYAGGRESSPSPAYCAAGGSVATTVRLPFAYARSTYRQRDNTQFTSPGDPGMNVGFSYSKSVHTLGDDYHNFIYRTAVAFDLGPFVKRRIVTAKLHLTIASSQGAGNNHSCATDVGTGTEFWWLNANWLEGQFGLDIAPTDTGPEITADVTQLVAPWLRGEPNYGFVLKNADENLGAFTDKRCETAYANPVLELTYY